MRYNGEILLEMRARNDHNMVVTKESHMPNEKTDDEKEMEKIKKLMAALTIVNDTPTKISFGIDYGDFEAEPKNPPADNNSEHIIVTSPWIIPVEYFPKVLEDFHIRGNSVAPIKCPNCEGKIHSALKHYLGGLMVDFNLCYNCHTIWSALEVTSTIEDWKESLKKYLQHFGFVPEYKKDGEKLAEF